MEPSRHYPTDDRANGKSTWLPQDEGASLHILPEGDSHVGVTRQSNPAERGSASSPQRLLAHLGRSKLIEWMVTYLAMAWLVLQLVQTLGEIWPLPISFQRGVSVVLGFLFFPAAVISWFHGERGRQKVCPLELTLLGAMLAMAAAAVWSLSGR